MMKISVDGRELFALSETQKKVIQNDILSEEFEADMYRRLQYSLVNKYERCFERLKNEWDARLQGRLDSVPTDPEAYAELVFSQRDYKNRSQRESS